MKVLLDTHAMYWYIEGDPQLRCEGEDGNVQL
jgi:PIN domain nuclease of toxin-antitoxin system